MTHAFLRPGPPSRLPGLAPTLVLRAGASALYALIALHRSRTGCARGGGGAARGRAAAALERARRGTPLTTLYLLSFSTHDCSKICSFQTTKWRWSRLVSFDYVRCSWCTHRLNKSLSLASSRNDGMEARVYRVSPRSSSARSAPHVRASADDQLMRSQRSRHSPQSDRHSEKPWSGLSGHRLCPMAVKTAVTSFPVAQTRAP